MKFSTPSKMKWIFIQIILSVFYVTNAENCDKLGVLLYEDIACNPVGKSGDCPLGFDCENRPSSDENHCLFHGKTFSSGEDIDRNYTYASCDVGCRCSKDEAGTSFVCAILDCPEWLGVPIGKDCYRKYKVGECCSVGQVCPPFDDVAVCEVDGTKYREGERFNPKNRCLDCVCQKGFSGEFVEPFCKRKSCSVELRHSGDIKKNCAPIYYIEDQNEDSLCCPSSWTCPQSNDVNIEPNTNGNAEVSCKFGEKVVKGNEQFSVSVEEFGKKRDVICKCIMPPLVTCVGNW